MEEDLVPGSARVAFDAELRRLHASWADVERELRRRSRAQVSDEADDASDDADDLAHVTSLAIGAPLPEFAFIVTIGDPAGVLHLLRTLPDGAGAVAAAEALWGSDGPAADVPAAKDIPPVT